MLSMAYATPWTIQWLHISINCICGTPPAVVIGSRNPSMRRQRHPSLVWSSSALQLCIGAFLLCTQQCRHVHSLWSGVFNLLKFNHISKKEWNGHMAHQRMSGKVTDSLPATRYDRPLSVTHCLARRLLVRPNDKPSSESHRKIQTALFDMDYLSCGINFSTLFVLCMFHTAPLYPHAQILVRLSFNLSHGTV